jgi:hypothetical protein
MPRPRPGLGRGEAALLDVRVHFAVAVDEEAELLGSQAPGGHGFFVAFKLPMQGRTIGDRELRGAGLAASIKSASHVREGGFAVEKRPQVALECWGHDVMTPPVG